VLPCLSTAQQGALALAPRRPHALDELARYWTMIRGTPRARWPEVGSGTSRLIQSPQIMVQYAPAPTAHTACAA